MAGTRPPKAPDAKAEPKADEAVEEAAPGASQESSAPEPQEAPPEALKRRYKADRALGSLRRGEVFEADASHPAVKSGYVTLLDDGPPDAVTEALQS